MNKDDLPFWALRLMQSFSSYLINTDDKDEINGHIECFSLLLVKREETLGSIEKVLLQGDHVDCILELERGKFDTITCYGDDGITYYVQVESPWIPFSRFK